MAKIRVNTLLDEKQFVRLKILSRATRIRMAEFIREGLDMVFSKYEKILQKSPKKGKK